MPSDRPIFVVGCPRSGTTMLQLMLHAHPRIALPPESRFLLPGYARRHEIGDLRDLGRRRDLAQWIVRTRQFRDLGLDDHQVVDAVVAAPPTLGSAFGTVFRLYADRFGKPRWGDKRPAYLRHLPQLLRLFPDAQIITIMRDGRDCVASLKEAPWCSAGLGDLIATWARAADAYQQAARRYGADTLQLVRYEDLVADPQAQLRALCRFLGEDYDPAMAEPSELAAVAVPAYKIWHTRTHGRVTSERVRSWQHRLTPEEIQRCESVFGSRLARFGYESSRLGVPRAGDRILRARLAARHRLGPAKVLVADAIAAMRTGNREPAIAAQLTAAELVH